MTANAHTPRGPQTGIAVTGTRGEYHLQRWRSTTLGAVYQPPFGGPYATTVEAKAARQKLIDGEAGK